MKKLSIFLSMAAVALGFASCSDDHDPIYTPPTEFTLNVPSMQDQYINLTEGNTLELVASQPDYGYSAVAVYTAEMSLTEDFAEPYELSTLDAHQAKMIVKQESVATGLCTLLGLESEDDYNTRYPNGMDYMKVYFRAKCQLEGVESSLITSNVVSYNNLKGYFAVTLPGYIYLVGSPEGWAGPEAANAAHYADWRLFESPNAIGSKIYSATFELPAAPMFRFYTALTGWDADSYGYQVEDNPTDFELVDGSFTEKLIAGKGSFNFPNFEGGTVTIIVDMADPNNMTFTMYAGEVEVVTPMYIYALGNQFGNWTEPNEAALDTYMPYRLTSMDNGKTYTAKLPVTAGDLYFRFAMELAGWDGPQIGIQEADEAMDVSFDNGMFQGPYVTGKGSWHFVLDEDATISLTVNTEDQTVVYVLE